MIKRNFVYFDSNYFDMLRIVIIVTFFLAIFHHANAQKDGGLYQTRDGRINFTSDAPLELIQAASSDMVGIINARKRVFAFRVWMESFDGFNSRLQRTHFNENYLESKKYPYAEFRGKIIESVDFTKDQVNSIRAKGILKIHGVEQERIIRSRLEVRGDQLIISADFEVPLTDHDIRIPRIVNQKIATQIDVQIRAELRKR